MIKNPTFASRWNVDEIDRQYALWLDSPSSVSTEWQYFFEGFHLGSEHDGLPDQMTHLVQLHLRIERWEKNMPVSTVPFIPFRDIGHTQGTFDPLSDESEGKPPVKSLERLGFDPNDLERSSLYW